MRFYKALLFPIQFQILAYSLLLVAFIAVFINVYVAILLFLISFLIITAYSGIEFKGNKYREFNAFYFIKTGEWKSYEGIEKIFIKNLKTSQRFYGRANTSSVINVEKYIAFLKFSDGTTIELKTAKKKAKLLQKLDSLKSYLHTTIQDQSR